MNVLPAIAIAASLLAGTDLALLRSALAKATEEATRDSARVARADDELTIASEELARREKAVRDGEWFAARAHKNQLATVNEARNELVLAKDALRRSEKARDEAQTALRVALFEEASRLLEDGDAESRSGRREIAQQRYSSGMTLLKEAAAKAGTAPADPWAGYGHTLRLVGNETGAELERQANAYRAEAADIERKLELLAPELQAAAEAASAWERLSRFRGVLERAGGTPASDPRPTHEALLELHRRGTELHALAEENTRRIEALLAEVRP